MNIRKFMWVVAVTLASAGGVGAQAPAFVAAASPGCAPAGDCCAPQMVTICVKTTGPKECCFWNRFLEKLFIRKRCYVQIQCPAVPCCQQQACCQTQAAPACGAPCVAACGGHCRGLFHHKQEVACCPVTCCPTQNACAPAPLPAAVPAAVPAVVPAPVPATMPAPGSLQQAAAPTAGGTEPPVVAPRADATAGYFEAMQAAQAADARAFKQIMEKRLATIAAMRAVQQNDMAAIGQLEAALRQTRQGAAPAVPATATSAKVSAPTERPNRGGEQVLHQVEDLGKLVNDLSRNVKSLSQKVDTIQGGENNR